GRAEGAGGLARKSEEAIGDACSLGSINCRARLPAQVEAEAGAYPQAAGVPRPAGPFNVQRAALVGAERGTDLLRQRAIADRHRWPAFDAALTQAQAQGRSWPGDAHGVPWEVHHVKPVFMGGDSVVDNLFPLPRATHQLYTNWWNAIGRAFRNRFTEQEWDLIYSNQRNVPGSRVRQVRVR